MDEITRRCRRLAALFMAAALTIGPAVPAGPVYEPTRPELEQVLADLTAWLPGNWDSFPQVYYERLVQPPKMGEHEHWHRAFGRIDAPQIGTHVFYGQINVGGRSGEMMLRSQIIYNAVIDEARGVVSITGQSPSEPEKYVNLHLRPELWKQVRQRDPAAVRCDFVWRRSGTQIVGTLEGKKEEHRKYGPGTCTYMSGQMKDVEFYADAEWVLSPEQLWLYDINRLAGHTFVGRDDRTHIRLYKSRPFSCTVKDAAGERRLAAHDRGFATPVTGTNGRSLELLLLRAELPAAGRPGLEDRLRLGVLEAGRAQPVSVVEAPTDAESIEFDAQGVTARCTLATQFGPVGP